MGSDPIVVTEQPTRVTTDDLLAWFPKARMAIIAIHPDRPRRPIVEWASPEQLRLFPGLQGQCCYDWTKGFSQPCKSCPCLKAIDDRRIHHALVPSPRTKKEAATAAEGSEPVDLIYALLVALPIDTGPDGSQRVLEISMDSTAHERATYDRAAQEHKFAARLSRLLETASSTSTANEFVLFGAVTDGGLAFASARLLAVGQYDSSTNLRSLVSDSLSLVRNRNTVPKLQLIERRLPKGFDPGIVASLRGVLFPLIQEDTFDPQSVLSDLLVEYGLPSSQGLERQLSIPQGVRLDPQTALAPILGHSARLHGVLVVNCGQSAFITEDDLVRLSTFALFVSNAYVRRDIEAAYDKAVHSVQALTESYGDAADELLLTAAVVTGLGHDLRSTSRQLALWTRSLIGEIASSKRQSSAVQPVIKEVQGLLSLQKVLLDRIETPARLHTPRYTKHNLPKLMRDVAHSLEHSLDDLGVKLTIRSRLDPANESIECDEFLVRQVFINLVDNSCFWLSDSAQKLIEITLQQAGTTHIEIEYRDSGPGIVPEMFQEIWRPFFTMKPKGMGLGLTIVERIVEAHRGEIEPFLDSGWGACFRIQLPVT